MQSRYNRKEVALSITGKTNVRQETVTNNINVYFYVILYSIYF